VQRKRLIAHTSRFLPAKDALRIAAFFGEMANLPFPDEDLLPCVRPGKTALDGRPDPDVLARMAGGRV